MKNIKTIIFIILFPLSLMSQNDSLWQIIKKGNALYKENKFLEAIETYKQVLKKGYTAAELYYNIGNAYFKSGNIPYSILYYEKALRLEPNNKKIKNNLQVANSLIADSYQENKQFVLDRLYEALLTIFSSNTWAILSLILFTFSLIAIFLFLYGKKILIRKIGFLTGITLFTLSLVFYWFAVDKGKSEKGGDAAIVIQTTTIKSSPADSGTDLFLVHPGIKLRICDKSGEWLEIKLPNKKEGWIKKEVIEII